MKYISIKMFGASDFQGALCCNNTLLFCFVFNENLFYLRNNKQSTQWCQLYLPSIFEQDTEMDRDCEAFKKVINLNPITFIF